MKMVMTGNHAAAYAAMVCKAEVIAAYPITPQTTVVEKIAELIANGECKAEFIKVESEHSAMASCISASQTGARTFTATSAHGLALMHEMLQWAAAARTPVIMSNVNRAMGPPWSVWADHTDSMCQRDTGWIQFYAESNQEVLDTLIQCFKVCENRDVLLPAMVCEDAFYLSHTVEVVDIPDQNILDDFIPPYDPQYKLDVDKPHGFGSLSMPHQWYMELRYLIANAHDKAREKFRKVHDEFEKKFGRGYGGLLDCYKCDDADIVLLGMGTMAGTAREVVDKLRNEGKNVGFARLRMLRPFPLEEIRDLGKKVSFIGVMDRSFTFGYEGPVYTEVKSALYGSENIPMMKDYIVGIGGRDITMDVVEKIYKNAEQIHKKGLDWEVEWIDLKGKQNTWRKV